MLPLWSWFILLFDDSYTFSGPEPGQNPIQSQDPPWDPPQNPPWDLPQDPHPSIHIGIHENPPWFPSGSPMLPGVSLWLPHGSWKFHGPPVVPQCFPVAPSSSPVVPPWFPSGSWWFLVVPGGFPMAPWWLLVPGGSW